MQAGTKDTFSRPHTFPVTKIYDSEKAKWNKAPAIPKGQNWQTYQASQRTMTRAENIGIVVPDRKVIVDLDEYKGATRAAVDKALGISLDWESALIQRTVSGGSHYAFMLPEGAELPQGADLLGIPGFDLRCAGKGWICTGDGYTDCTLVGLPDALGYDEFPVLPPEAFAKLCSNTQAVEVDDLESALATQTLDDLTLEDLRDYLLLLPKEDLEHYEPWLKVGMALHHQTGGSLDGLELFKEWSELSSQYNEAECESKWRSFAKRDHITKPTRFDYVIGRAGGRKSISPAKLESLLDRAAQVETSEQLAAFQKEVSAIDLLTLPTLQRAEIAQALHKAFAKEAGSTLSEVKKALRPTRSKTLPDQMPQWLSGWVYLLNTNKFYHRRKHQSLDRQAFNAKHNREKECKAAGFDAYTLALDEYQIRLVADTMVWPGAGEFFEYQGIEYINGYVDQRQKPCHKLTVDGAAAIDRFEKHIALLLPNKAEQDILKDVLTYVFRELGKRVHWAVLLQGGQGIGKTYFTSLAQAMLGSAAGGITSASLNSPYNEWAANRTFISIEEMHVSGASPFDIMDGLKPLITNDSITINQKYRDSRDVPNWATYFMTTNRKMAVPVDDGDRRYCILFSALQTHQDLIAALGGEDKVGPYFKSLFGDLKEHPDALAYHFQYRNLSPEFEPQGRAPRTESFEAMANLNKSEGLLDIEDAIDLHYCGAINGNVVDYTWLSKLSAADGVILPTGRKMSAILTEMGYSQIRKQRLTIANTNRKHYVWFRNTTEAQAIENVRRFHQGDDNSDVPF